MPLCMQTSLEMMHSSQPCTAALPLSTGSEQPIAAEGPAGDMPQGSSYAKYPAADRSQPSKPGHPGQHTQQHQDSGTAPGQGGLTQFSLDRLIVTRQGAQLWVWDLAAWELSQALAARDGQAAEQAARRRVYRNGQPRRLRSLPHWSRVPLVYQPPAPPDVRPPEEWAAAASGADRSRGWQVAWRWGSSAPAPVPVKAYSSASTVRQGSLDDVEEGSSLEGEELLIIGSDDDPAEPQLATQQQGPADSSREGAGEGWVDLVGDREKSQGDWQVRASPPAHVWARTRCSSH
jgi:hypothetical protein